MCWRGKQDQAEPLETGEGRKRGLFVLSHAAFILDGLTVVFCFPKLGILTICYRSIRRWEPMQVSSAS